MGMDKTELLKGKEVSIYFDDGSSITRKDGTIIEITDITLIFQEHGQTQIIPFSRIIRVVEKNCSGGNFSR